MRWIMMTAMAGVCALGVGQSTADKRAHTETSFDLVVRGPYAETTKLFGPEGERVWAGKHWNPQFIYPNSPKDEQGAVFTIQHGPFSAVWVVAQHDLSARQFQYIYLISEMMVCTIDIRFAPVDASTTKVHVTYARTAVSAAGDGPVATMTEGDREARPEWQRAIDTYLAGQKDSQPNQK